MVMYKHNNSQVPEEAYVSIFMPLGVYNLRIKELKEKTLQLIYFTRENKIAAIM